VRVGTDLDTDWTLHADWAEEQRLREERNLLIKQQLDAGQTVAYRSSGWSLFPRVRSNDICCYLPVRFPEQVEEDDIVFCQVQPEGYFYAHLVKEKKWDHDRHAWKFLVSNLEGRINGHCYIEHMVGKLLQVLH